MHTIEQNFNAQLANCITENVTLRSIVASGKMLLSDRRRSQSEVQHDGPEKQARVGRSGATTMTCTDLCTGWTDVTGLLHRSQKAVSETLCRMRQRLPFPLLGIDSDNGGEFTLAPGASAGVNELLYRYCLDQEITFTRSRPYEKNDQAHVEQKNWSVVLIAKERIGNKTIKRYDTAKSPYQRVLERQDISLEANACPAHPYVQLNPAELRRRLDQKIAKLWKISR